MKHVYLIFLFALILVSSLHTQAQLPGTTDSTFAVKGIQLLGSEAEALEHSHQAMVRQPDGKILIAGHISAYEKDYKGFVIYRLLPEGGLDPTFGTAGKQTLAVDGNATTLALQEDGKILVAGYVMYGPNIDFRISRLHEDGSLDDTFGRRGSRTIDLGGTDYPVGMELRYDGGIVLVGTTHRKSELDRKIAIVQLDKQGQNDDRFGEEGQTSFSIGTYATCKRICFQKNNKLLLVGTAKNPDGRKFKDIVALRVLSNGELDQTFGSQGITRLPVGREHAYGSAIIEDANQHIIVAGYAKMDSSRNFDMVMAKLTSRGKLYAPFGTEGISAMDGGGADYPTDLALSEDGKIWILGTSNYKFTLARVMPNGKLDHTFGTQGMHIVDKVGGRSRDYTSQIAFNDRGQALVAGVAQHQFTVVRLHGDPSLQGIRDVVKRDMKKMKRSHQMRLDLVPGIGVEAFIADNAEIPSLIDMPSPVARKARSGTQSLYSDGTEQKLILRYGGLRIGNHCTLLWVKDSENDVHLYAKGRYRYSIPLQELVESKEMR